MMKELPPGNESLIEFIRLKERKERRSRIITWVVGSAFLLFSALGSGYYFLYGPGQPAESTVYEIATLTRSKVASLLEETQAPLLVQDSYTKRVDTIRSVQDYMLLVTAISDDPGSYAAQENAYDPRETVVQTSSPMQSDSASRPSINVDQPLVDADVMPAFPGGEAALYRFLSSHIRYPEDALRKKVEGKVFVRFVIQEDGSITDLQIRKGIGFGCDEEALRVIRMMPRWLPGELAGQKVAVFSSLAVNFKFL
ncbi:MAG: energy transducer TonB [Bacteroidota bacterium]